MCNAVPLDRHWHYFCSKIKKGNEKTELTRVEPVFFRTTCNVGSGAVPRGDDSGSTAEEIFNAIQGNSSAPSPIANADDSEPAAASPGQPASQEDFTVSEPPSKRSKKGRSCDYFEEQLLSQLGKHATENEAFGQSIAMSLDRMPTRIASRFKVKIMELLAEFDQYEAEY